MQVLTTGLQFMVTYNKCLNFQIRMTAHISLASITISMYITSETHIKVKDTADVPQSRYVAGVVVCQA